MREPQGWGSGISVPDHCVITGKYFNLGYFQELTHVKKCLFTLSPSYSIYQPSHSSHHSPPEYPRITQFSLSLYITHQLA